MLDFSLLDKFIAREREWCPRSGYRLKKNVLLHKVIAFYIRPFNARYLTGYTSTIYPYTDFGSIDEDDAYRPVKTEFHEGVHKWDRTKEGFMWSLKYAYPQIVALPLLLATLVLGGLWCWVGFGAFLVLFHAGLLSLQRSAANDPESRPSKKAKGVFFGLSIVGSVLAILGSAISGKWFALGWLLTALFISPWPFKSVWRRDAELRGYTASLYQEWLKHGQVRSGIIDHYVSRFTRSDYFWMERDASLVHRELSFQVARFPKSGFLEYWEWSREPVRVHTSEAEPYKLIYSFMRDEGLIGGRS